MASAVLHPDAALFPPGTTVEVREKALLAPTGSLPGGSALSSPTVASDGSLTVTGLTEGKRYEARATVEGALHQLEFAPEVAPPSSGLTQAEVETLISEKAVSTVSPAFTGTPTAPTAAEGDNSTKLATTKYADRAVSAEATTRASADTTEKSARETLAGEAVKLTGTQTVAGVKTFSSSPVVPTPTTALQAVTKAYVDAAIEGLNAHPNVRVATAAALPANAYLAGVITGSGVGALTVDGIAVAAGNRVLVKNEVAKANNGLYVVTAPGAVAEAFVLTRAADMNENAEVPGAFVFAEEGTVNSKNGFFVASPGPFTIGTTAIEWSQFTGAGDLIAGSGITLTGNEVSAAKAREEAEAATKLTVHAIVTESATTATVQQLTPVNAEGGAKTIKLPEPTSAGQRIGVEKKDGTQNEVTVEGSIRGEASTTTLGAKGEVVEYVSDAAKSWWPIARAVRPVWTNVEGINGNAVAAGTPYSEAVQAALFPDGMVRVSGGLKINVEIIAAQTLFTLPAACRPEKQRGAIIGGLGGTASINVIIKTTGVVENVSAIKTTIGIVQLDSIGFRLKG